MKCNVYKVIWSTSERLHIGLGRFAPYVFSHMIDRKGDRLDG